MKRKHVRVIGITMYVIAALCLINSISTLIYKNSIWPFFLFLALVFTLIGYIHLHIKPNLNSKIIKFTLWGVHALAGLVILSFLIIESLIIGFGSRKDSTVPDYVVILGAGLWGDTPSLTLSQRLDESLKLLKLLPGDVKIVVSGGQGPGESITEAEAMKKYLTNRGISEERIIKEDKSTNTMENMIFTRRLLKEIDSRSTVKITIVTSSFHMYRSSSLAKKAGFEEVTYWSAPITPYLIPTYYIREYVAVIKSSLLDNP
ncbi:MAG: YdcF family protein [Bacillota bacterium]|nr:YdcF family protein [Bacillota bacterium]